MANSDSQLPPELECHAVFATTHWSMVVSAGDVFTERLHSSGSARPTGRRSTPTSVVARLGQRAFRLAIVGLAWSAVMLLAQTPELRVALPEVRTLAGRPQHAIVRSDGAIVVSGQFAGNEGDPFSNLLVLGSDGRVLKRLPPLLYAREPASYEAYRPQYRYCDIAFEDGTFIVETETTISIGDYSTSLNRPIHLNADGTVDEGFNARFGTNAAVFGAGSIVQSDGKLLFAGAFDGVPVRRIFPDGSPDPGFTQQVGSAGLPPVGLRMAISPNGKIWLWPGNFSSNGFTFKQLVRLNGDGSVDSTFDATAVEARYIAGAEVLFAGVRRGFRYALEASTDLRTWMKLEESGPIQFDPAPEFTLGFFDADAGRFRQRFYNVVETAP